MKEIPKAYNPSEYEDEIYRKWEQSGYFNSDNLGLPSKADYFSIAMPPPNSTGVLHLGHAIMLAIQDLVIRYQRMRGRRTLWLPGTDHAAIATQTVVEKKLLKESGQTRQALGREQFLEEVKKFVEQSKNTIRSQMRKMGSSCDWSRERYTLDAGLSRAVQEVFVRMYRDGLIYRGYRIVNWCPRCASTLADDEIEYRENIAKLYTFRYSKDFPLAIATTRPETKLGDTAVAVNPRDKRYQKYLGQTYTVDLGHGPQEIKIVAEPSVDPAFGTGALGVTPAHSLIDSEIAERNKLPSIKVIGEDGRMTAAAGKNYEGLTVLEAREKFVAWLREQKLLEKEPEEISQSLSICYRCETPIEPLPSKQWFINVNSKFKIQNSKLKGVKPGSLVSLKELAKNAVESGDIEIIPDRFRKVYYHWIENLRDWCISRQIWFGHRMPVWYRRGTWDKRQETRNKGQGTREDVYVGLGAPRGDDWIQDEDTLDTWFSSGLWTFSTLLDKDFEKYKSLDEWIKKSLDLKRFHPTSLMETGYDILFFWVARMILMTTYVLGEIPFKKVYLHGLVRDEQGRKMSKSFGNVIDPLETIKKYGADATRLSLLIGTTPGNDIKLSEEKIAGFRNFTNKLWNISRFILMSVNNIKVDTKKIKPKTLADKWILARLNEAINAVTKQIDNYEFSIAGELLRDFTWSELADWYLEIAKIEKDKDEILIYSLERLLKLWHPFMPFVTEAIWSEISKKKMLMVEEWPEVKGNPKPTRVSIDFDLIKRIISDIRNWRAEHGVEPKDLIDATIFVGKDINVVKENYQIIKSLCRLSNLKIERHVSKDINEEELYDYEIKINRQFDKQKEKDRLNKEVEEVTKYITSIEKNLANKAFVARAPKVIVEEEKSKLTSQKEKLRKLEEQLKNL